MVRQHQRDIAPYRAPGQQGKVLKDIGQRVQAAFGRATHLQDSPLVRAFQPVDQAQQRGFTASRRADKHHEFLIVHFQVDALDDGKAFETFLQILDFQVGHDGPPLGIII